MKRSVAIFIATQLMALAAYADVDPGLKNYRKVGGVSGSISSVGSDTLANLMTLWAEEYRKFYPNVQVQIQAAGSSTASPALIEGSSNFGPMSRVMKDKEVADFEKRYGYKPMGVPVAIDALAVFVNKDNPIEGLSLTQVDAIFSATRRCGAARDAGLWRDVGMKGEWTNRPIQLFGRNSASGTYGYFKSVALCKGDYRKSVNEQPGSSSVVQSVGTSVNAIGYSGIGYRTADVRAIPLSRKGTGYSAPTAENIEKGDYPLARFLYIYVNKVPGQSLPPLEREFLRMVYSKQGQKVVVKDGYIPLPASIAEKYLKELGG